MCQAFCVEGLQSFAGAEIGASQRIRETPELERNTSLDWIEDDLNELQVRLQQNTFVEKMCVYI